MGINNNVNVGKSGGVGPVGGPSGIKGSDSTKGITAIAGLEGGAKAGASSSEHLLRAGAELVLAMS